MFARDPLKTAKETEPMIMIKMQKYFSPLVLAEISPYPTVVIVVTVK